MKLRTPLRIVASLTMLMGAAVAGCGAENAEAPRISLPAQSCPSATELTATLRQTTDGASFVALRTVIQNDLIAPAPPSYPAGRLSALLGVFLDVARNVPIDTLLDTLTSISESSSWKPLLPLLEGVLRYLAGTLAAPNNTPHYEVTTLLATLIRGCDARSMLDLFSAVLHDPNLRQLLTLLADLTSDASFNQLLDNFKFGNCDPNASGCIGRDGFIALLAAILGNLQTATVSNVHDTFTAIKNLLATLPIIDITKPPWSDLLAVAETMFAQQALLTPFQSILTCHLTNDSGGRTLFGAVFDLLAIDSIGFKNVMGGISSLVGLDPDGKVLATLAQVVDYLRANLEKFAVLQDIIATILEPSRVGPVLSALVDLISIKGANGKTAFDELMYLMKVLMKGCTPT